MDADFLSQAMLSLTVVILYVAAGGLGFAAGWRAFAMFAEARRRDEERDVEDLRHALTDAQVRRARRS
ncbi:MAG: hypothetical protein ACREH4_09155 [Vitreimonas sp.]